MNKQNCSNCVFAELIEKITEKNGDIIKHVSSCNRYPPVLIPYEAKALDIRDDIDEGFFYDNDWCWNQPVVNSADDGCTDWCGEYINKYTGERLKLIKDKP